MSRWWRAYDEAVDDPKLCLLTDRQHRAWFNLCCITSQNGGSLPTIEAVAFKLRMTVPKAESMIGELISLGLIDLGGDGNAAPHNWNARQYKSDVSTERVQRFRNKERNVSETPPETEADTEDRSEKKDSRAVAKATRPPVDQDFEEFWKAYPKREGPNPKAEARKAFDALVKREVDPKAIIAAVKRFAVAERANIGTRFLPHASTWLRGQRHEDYLAEAAQATGPPKPPADHLPSDEELRKKYGQSGPVHTETKAAGANGAGADHSDELRSAGTEIRPNLRPF